MFTLPVGRSSRIRHAVAYASLLLAVLGWVCTVWLWVGLGNAARAHAGFDMARTVAITFSITYTIAVVMPDKARIYALGFRDGAAFAEEHEGAAAPVRHLRPVR